MNKETFLSNKKIQVVILVGGYGRRLGKLTVNTPKPLININNKPFLEYLVSQLIKQNFRNFLFLAGFKGNKLKKHIKKVFSKKFLNLDFYIEKKPMGTGYVLKKAIKKLNKNFILINGDTFTSLNFKSFLKNINQNKLINICVSKKESKSSGNFYIKNKKIFFEEKPKQTSGLINCGIYFLNKKLVNFININKNSFEKDIIPEQIANEQVNLIKKKIRLIDIGTFSGIKEFKSYIK